MTSSPAKTVIVEVARLDLEGDGLVEIAGRECRVPCVIPGERVEVAPASRGAEAALVRVVTASPFRVTPPCRHFGPCGGCAWQHIAYEEQLRLKQRLLQRLLDDALGPRAPGVRPTLATLPLPWHYRNKVHFVFGPGGGGRPLVMGHYRRGSRTVIPVVECPVHAEEGNRVAFAMRDALQRNGIAATSAEAGTGIARHVVVRVAESTGDYLATLVVTENVKALRRVTRDFLGSAVGRAADGPATAVPRRPRAGLHLSVHDRPGPFLFGRETLHLAGARTIRETAGGVTYVVSPTSFFQTNVRAARALLAYVIDSLADPSHHRVLDLYAGAGLFALPLARGGRSVTAVEESGEAVAAAGAAARENGLAGRVRAIASRVEDAMFRLTPPRCPRWDAVVLDPPRQGCPPAVLDWILGRLQPRRVVYVSCNPEALAADLRRAPAAGYSVEEVQPVDMFPHTAHIESVAVLARP